MTYSKNELERDHGSLHYFQNLVPGKQDSPFIDRYCGECLDEEKDEEMTSARRQLLNNFPPVLSFYEQQKKRFYEEEARRCQQFCCGGMQVQSDLLGNPVLQQQDNYMLSVGSGKLYEGGAKGIKDEMQEDIRQEPFGSEKQQQIISGLNQFNSIVEQREAGHGHSPSSATEQAANEQGYNPFKTTPKPTKE